MNDFGTESLIFGSKYNDFLNKMKMKRLLRFHTSNTFEVHTEHTELLHPDTHETIDVVYQHLKQNLDPITMRNI